MMPTVRVDELYERSKDDDAIIVGSEVRELIGEIRRLQDAIGRGAGRIDSLEHAMKLPVPADLHIEGLRGSLPQIREELLAALPPEVSP